MTIKLFRLFFLEKCGLFPVVACMLVSVDDCPGSGQQQLQQMPAAPHFSSHKGA